jgi:cystinosin
MYHNIPSFQALLNYGRQSTDGFAIKGVMLDFSGSVLSLLQAVLDSTNSSKYPLILTTPA